VRLRSAAALLASALAGACASEPRQHTLAALRDVEPDVSQVEVGDSLDRAMQGYRKFLEEAPVSELTPEAMRRLADLKLEKEYGPLGDAQRAPLPAPSPAPVVGERADLRHSRAAARPTESDAEFEQRAAAAQPLPDPGGGAALELPVARDETAGPLEAIALYDRILAEYPTYQHNDRVLYQKARVLDELARVDEAVAVTEQLIARYPGSAHVDEVHFRRAEYFFTRRRWRDAESAYSAITRKGGMSEYYEPALYKLGWTLYKQDLLEEALDEYVRLLDHKVSSGYDFDQTHDEDTERRVADTLRVISLSFSNLGGADSVSAYFAARGERSYEDRIYAQLGEFYLEKRRYEDAAKSYRAFVALHPLHASSPRFGMRVIEIYEAGSFPRLVLEAKKEFAATYGLDAEYWRHFDVAAAPEVIAYLKRNLADLASHHHALFQSQQAAEQRSASSAEAARWYRAYLASFPRDPESAGINHRLADLLLEQRDFAAAAREYERTAYDHPEHERAAAAGYAAIYAHRESLKSAGAADREAIVREAVRSTLRFVDAFPRHEQAAPVLGAAVDDLYAMKELALAIANGRKLIDGYPDAEAPIRRSAWIAIAHSAFELADYGQAEQAYGRVLELTSENDASRAGFADNLAAAIYKQGEQASSAGDAHAAAGHFLRIAEAAPSSSIRASAEYDAAAALIRVADWAGAAHVLEEFRASHPEHELARDATKQLARAYREQGDLPRAAAEYERVAAEAETPELRGEALLVVAELYETASLTQRALAAYLAYVAEFPSPVETAVETRAKIAAIYEAARDETARRTQLRQIVALDAAANGAERTPRVRTLAARAALVLAQDLCARLGELRLVQPFEQNLREKKQRMDAALAALAALVEYEVADVTAAATFYTAEAYAEFARALTQSERPAELSESELRDYDAALEDEALQFEERAIEVHEKNLELVRVGVWNAWVERSLAQLSVLVPGRYAKPEESSGFLDSLETYAYRSPGAALEPSSVAEAARQAPESASVAPPASAAEQAEPAEASSVADAAQQPPDAAAEAAQEMPIAPPASAADQTDAEEASDAPSL
jgi:outer membrane protein assembly factor BamD (BamD/ComL family)